MEKEKLKLPTKVLIEELTRRLHDGDYNKEKNGYDHLAFMIGVACVESSLEKKEDDNQ